MTDPVFPAEIDPIDRLAILAAALPGAVVGQRRIDASFDAVWRVIEDLETMTPRYEPGVARVRVLEQHGQRLRLLVEDISGREQEMDAKLRPGWCVMQSETIVVAFAARRLGDQTLLAHLEHWRGPEPLPSEGRPGGPGAPGAVAKIDAELRVIETLAVRAGRLDPPGGAG
jgi:hypothetical protein